MPVTGISSLCIYVADWETAKSFYAGVLGLNATACDDTAGWAAFATKSPAPPLFLVRNSALAGKPGGTIIGFDITDADKLLDAIRSAGGAIDDHIQEGPGVRIYTVRDPDGNPIELSEAV